MKEIDENKPGKQDHWFTPWSGRSLGQKQISILALVLGVSAVTLPIYQLWWADIEYRTEHYLIYSTASLEQTQELGNVIELLHDSYLSFFKRVLPYPRSQKSLSVKFYKDRDEFRRANFPARWAEAIYRYPYTHQYYEDSPKWYQWSLHESVHQLNNELSHFKLPLWAEEGLAEYFSTSQLKDGVIKLGVLDYETYPLWWISSFNFSGDLSEDIQNNRFIRLSYILTNRNGPSMDDNFNQYYFHWLTLVHFLFEYENGRHKNSFIAMISGNQPFSDFERLIGPLAQVEKEWYAHFLEIVRGADKQSSNLPCPSLSLDG